MEIGYVTPNSWGLDTPKRVIELAVRAEQLGAHTLWVSHHVLHRGFVGERLSGGRPYHDPVVMLTAMAAVTSRSRLGTSVLVLPYLHPMPLAKELATLDHLCEGRLDVGVGVGGLRPEHEPINQVPFERRGKYGDECLAVMQGLWSGKSTSFHGEFFDFQDVEAHPGPFRPGGLPVLVGGHGPAALRRAARFAAGWHGIGIEPEQVAAQRDGLAAALRQADRSPEGYPFQVRLHIPVEDLDLETWKRRVDAYAAAGVSQLVLAPQSGDAALHVEWMTKLMQPLIKHLGR